MSLEALVMGETVTPIPSREATGSPHTDLLDWLHSGRLTLVDERKEAVSPERWFELPPDAQANALADFERVARGNTKAVVLFLRD
jgi:hypothetical protein